LTLHSVLSFGGGIIIGAAFAFLVGFWIGAEFGDINTRIDFCADETSGRFIADRAARDVSCQ
jgi:hypothetical protein